MIPLRDDQPSFSTPFINYFLIVLNVLVFLWELSVSHRALNVFMLEFGVVPHHTLAVLGGNAPGGLAVAILPLFTSMFLHASFLHVAGNMLFLWIFGDNVEDYLGHFTYLIFYLAQRTGRWGYPHSAEPIVANTQCGGKRRHCRRTGSLFHPLSEGASAGLVPADISVSRTRLVDARLLVCGEFPERHNHGDR